ncbi:hypothetical protein EXU85_27485 [Spirosoma sp. KCTC 42546]|uniref:DUF11 domain-containing protein n=1 Tax=Spirosoma sp. KCTC 42546 TaxID=2520506 RepID=UPI001157D115|nr:DUF11 domain-containing protein [Spirosoma sp. KCTC 42546]QDK82150.1 hypothetical protein EXU85_27485 [Spirosoma sp. KCTC 42546]
MKQFSTLQHALKGSIAALCFGLLLFAFQAKGQVYSVNSDRTILYTNITTGSTQESSPSPNEIVAGTVSLGSDGKYLYALTSYNGRSFQRWDRVTNTWTILADSPVDGITESAWFPTFDGDHTLYTINASYGGTNYKYDIPTNTWTTYAALPTLSITDFSGIYAAISYQASSSSLFVIQVNGHIYKYSIPTNTWTLESSTYGAFTYSPGLAVVGSDRYVLGRETASGTIKFFKNTTPLPPPTVSVNNSYPYEMHAYQGKLYSIIVRDLYEYNPMSNTWTQKNNLPSYNYGQCTEYKLPLPTVNLSLSVLPTTQTANKGETISYTYTLTSAGNADDVIVKVRPPQGLTLLSNTPQQGSYNPTTKLWNVGSVTAGNRTLVLTLKVD